MSYQPPPPSIETRPAATPPRPPHQEGAPRRRRPLRSVGLAIAALAVVALAAIVPVVVLGQAERDDEGIISKAGDITVLELRIGDCFDQPGAPSTTETVEIFSVGAMPCSEPHDFEVFHTFDLTAAELPNEAVIMRESNAGCLAAFEPYVGSSYEESELDAFAMWPTAGSWKGGDRTVVCSVMTMDGTKLVDSAEGSGR